MLQVHFGASHAVSLLPVTSEPCCAPCQTPCSLGPASQSTALTHRRKATRMYTVLRLHALLLLLRGPGILASRGAKSRASGYPGGGGRPKSKLKQSGASQSTPEHAHTCILPPGPTRRREAAPSGGRDGLNYVPQNSYIGLLTPGTVECGLPWTQCHCRCDPFR